MMKTSTERILTTHVGSLPRPPALLDILLAREESRAVDESLFETRTAEAVSEIVEKQIEAGVDIVSDGEMSKPSYTMYVRHRFTGIAPNAEAEEKGRKIMVGLDQLEHPDFMERMNHFRQIPFPGCVGPVSYRDTKPLERDLAHLGAAVTEHHPLEAFITAPSPGILTRFIPDTYYKNEDAYVEALAKAMRTEYQAIVRAGFLLQIDCPDLGSARHNQYRDKTEAEFIRIAERNVAALNDATDGLPSDRMRLHICWGNYEGPHTHDIPLAKVIGVCFKARPSAVSFEGANPRHEHEWEDLAKIRIPDDKILIPGVIDSTTNFVEHPRLVAQRICHYADIVGRERVIAGADCGFATFAGRAPIVATSIVWSKFKALAEGAQIATQRLWS
jgi:5-methyltetrahydropteroyltriglutamate--homocysteine methyltransferase